MMSQRKALPSKDARLKCTLGRVETQFFYEKTFEKQSTSVSIYWWHYLSNGSLEQLKVHITRMLKQAIEIKGGMVGILDHLWWFEEISLVDLDLESTNAIGFSPF